jgi:hypothetical protein
MPALDCSLAEQEDRNMARLNILLIQDKASTATAEVVRRHLAVVTIPLRRPVEVVGRVHLTNGSSVVAGTAAKFPREMAPPEIMRFRRLTITAMLVVVAAAGHVGRAVDFCICA